MQLSKSLLPPSKCKLVKDLMAKGGWDIRMIDSCQQLFPWQKALKWQINEQINGQIYASLQSKIRAVSCSARLHVCVHVLRMPKHIPDIGVRLTSCTACFLHWASTKVEDLVVLYHCAAAALPLHPMKFGGQNCFGGDLGRKAPIVVRKQLPGEKIRSSVSIWSIQSWKQLLRMYWTHVHIHIHIHTHR